MRYLPNILTIGRILVTPLVLLLIMTQTWTGQLSAVVLFVLASVSDYVDGQLARQMGARSRLGTYLDPLADKILVLGTFSALAVMEPQAVPWWAVAVIALRDLAVTGLRTWAESRGYTVRTLPAAKAKTMIQLFFLFSLMVLMTATHAAEPTRTTAVWMLERSAIPFLSMMAVVLVTVATGALYFMRLEYAPSPRHASSEQRR